MARFSVIFALLLAAVRLAAQDPLPEALKDLPLVELPARSNLPFLAVFLSGDGGWAEIDRQVGETLAAGGISVVGWNTLRYFLKRHGPDDTALDLEKILDYYTKHWKKREVLLLGYSRGADMLPFLVSRLPAALRPQVRLVVLLGPADAVRFQGLAEDALRIFDQAPLLQIRPELEKLRGMRILCFYGADEADSLCHGMDPSLAECVLMPGGHHFGGQYRQIADRILSELKVIR
jgi:type IV secretory pathway VirJ component